MIYEKKKIKVRKRDYYTIQILTGNAEETFKKAAQLKSDQGML